MSNTKRGGRRTGAGRPSTFGEAKEQRSVALSPRAWAFVAMLALQLDCSDNQAIERVIRGHPLFIPEAPDQV